MKNQKTLRITFFNAFFLVFLGLSGLAQNNQELMVPQGPFFVSRTMYDWVDNSRKEMGSSDTSVYREIPAQIWYPAKMEPGSQVASYRPRIEAFRESWGDESIEFIKSVKTHFSENSNVKEGGPYPIVLFSHGWGGRSSSYTTLLSNIASFGYIVVGINHPYLGNVVMANGVITQPNDSQFEDQASANLYYAQDVSFAINQLISLNNQKGSVFFDRIDVDRIIATGHSSGFPAASGASIQDKRIKGLISFDSGVPKVVREVGLDIPILLIRADSASYTDLFFRGENTHPKGTIYDVDFFRVHRGDFYDLVIPGTTHSSALDEYVFSTDAALRALSRRNHPLIADWIHAFIQRILFNSNLQTFDDPDSNVMLREIPGLHANED